MRWISIFLLLCLAAPAAGQDDIAIYFDDPGLGLVRFGDARPGQPFDLVVVADVADSAWAAEFVMTELIVEYPGVFKLSTTKLTNTSIDAGRNELGEYAMQFASCVEPGVLEIVRVQYGDFAGVLPDDIIVRLRGFEPGDSVETSFGGQPGYYECDGELHPLELAPWEGIPFCSFPPGSCALNITTILLAGWGCGTDLPVSGFSALKTRY